MIILDFSKAFDRLPHQRLPIKLCHYGIQGNAFQWIQSFLSSSNQQAVVDWATSDKAYFDQIREIGRFQPWTFQYKIGKTGMFAYERFYTNI